MNISLQVVTIWFKCPSSTTLDISIAPLETKQTLIVQLYKKDYNEFIYQYLNILIFLMPL